MLRPTVSKRRRSGTAAAEFVVLLPVMITLVLACIDFGAFAYRYTQVNNAARAGAIYGAMNPYPPSQQNAWEARIEETVKDEMFPRSDAAGRNRVRVQRPVVTIETPTGSNGLRRVQVTVQYDFSTLVAWPFIPRTVTMTGSAVMRSIR